MKHVIQDQRDQNRDRCTPRPDKTEIMDVLHQCGPAEGFSIEWIADRFPQQEGRI